MSDEVDWELSYRGLDTYNMSDDVQRLCLRAKLVEEKINPDLLSGDSETELSICASKINEINTISKNLELEPTHVGVIKIEVKVMKPKVLKALMAVACLVTLLVLWQYQKKTKYLLTSKRTFHKENVKHILFWTPFFSIEDYLIGFGSKPFSQCEYKNCFFTNNKSFLSVDKFDAILFHGSIYDKNRYGEPPTRKPNQVYVYVNGEPPLLTAPNLKLFNSFYNWTMTYRLDSEIQFPYDTFVKKDTNYVIPSTDYVQNKSKMMSWFVSNCRPSSKRDVLIKNVQNYVTVDVYGRCGPLLCMPIINVTSVEDCYEIVEKNYKFYFSGENSICKDYVTEKLYSLLKRNVVPVVYGGADYAKNAPPNSVINVNDFENVTQLVSYLKFLDANPTEYLKYFEWKKHYVIVSTPAPCQLCEKLNKPLASTIIKDLHEWSWGSNNEFCKENKNLPSIVSNLL
ncbi:hypothetical protein RN001_010825 [Aquatica leii]|uniref:Fucosyltransferase n=1 Tax=Aquatica leii TaxID=1421715 RepID=A0AAN7P738_9COLE|nr:hypothetical protein RN001_010825 [Aquatica leii]